MSGCVYAAKLFNVLVSISIIEKCPEEATLLIYWGFHLLNCKGKWDINIVRFF